MLVVAKAVTVARTQYLLSVAVLVVVVALALRILRRIAVVLRVVAAADLGPCNGTDEHTHTY